MTAMFWRGAALPRSRRAGGFREPEKAFMARVVLAAQLHHWAVYHTFDSRRSAAGFPDLVLARAGNPERPGRLLFRELKADDGVVTDAQRAWLERLRACGQDAGVWTPSMWRAIEEELA